MQSFGNSDDDERKYFELRQEGKIYVSKLFQYSEQQEDIRNVKIVFEGTDRVDMGEILGALQLRISTKGKNQVSAIVSQDNKKIRRITISSFNKRKNGTIISSTKDSFTFRNDELERLLNFLKSIDFIDFSNHDNFQIEDHSIQKGQKVIVDLSDANLISSIKKLDSGNRSKFLNALKSNLTQEDINTLLGRRQALQIFESQMIATSWSEKNWQDFFEQNPWIFGYGLDYRIMRTFDREMTVGSGGIANREKPIVDFLTTFKDYTALVEIKTPNALIFDSNRRGRSGTWGFGSSFIDAVSQVLEQKAEWLSLGQSAGLFNKSGSEKLEQRTRNAKVILIIGCKASFDCTNNERDRQIKLDTFELFRQENRSIEILTFDELLERAQFIVSHKQEQK